MKERLFDQDYSDAVILAKSNGITSKQLLELIKKLISIKQTSSEGLMWLSCHQFFTMANSKLVNERIAAGRVTFVDKE